MRWAGAVVLLVLPGSAWLVRAQARDAAEEGRRFYAEQACWQCHVQARDPSFPLAIGSRRAGPILDQARPPRSREWHRAHLYAPRAALAGSTMPSWAREFRAHPRAADVAEFLARYDTRDGSWSQDGTVTRAEYEAGGGEEWRAELERLDESRDGVIGRADAAPRASPRLEALLAYLAGIDRAVPVAGSAPREAKPADRARSIERGERLYLRHCAGCHGERADGDGALAPFFPHHPPRNFLRGEFKFRSTMVPDPPTDADLFRTIRAGAGPSMPAWPRLSDRETWDLVEFVKSNHPAYLPRELFVESSDLEFTRDGDTDDASGAALEGGRVVKRAGKWFWVADGKSTRIVDGAVAGGHRFRLGEAVYDWMEGSGPRAVRIGLPPLAYTRESAAIGARVYAEFGCADCHGERGRGDGETADRTRGSLGQVVFPTDYTRGARWLKGGADARSLVRSFLTGLHGTPMPAYSSNFAAARSAPPDRAAWHLAHFVMQQAGIPFDR